MRWPVRWERGSMAATVGNGTPVADRVHRDTLPAGWGTSEARGQFQRSISLRSTACPQKRLQKSPPVAVVFRPGRIAVSAMTVARSSGVFTTRCAPCEASRDGLRDQRASPSAVNSLRTRSPHRARVPARRREGSGAELPIETRSAVIPSPADFRPEKACPRCRGAPPPATDRASRLR